MIVVLMCEEREVLKMYSIKVNVLENAEGNVKGLASVVFANSFKVSNIAIVENKKGEFFVSMPRYASSKEQEYHDICNPITKEFREKLYNAILTTFEQASKGGEDKSIVGNSKDTKLSYNVKVTPFEREGSNIRGFGRVYLDDCFVINNISLLQGKHGVFVAMPSYKTKQMDENGKPVYQDICFPVTKEFREKLYGDIKSAYKREKEERKKQTGKPVPQQTVPNQNRPFR